MTASKRMTDRSRETRRRLGVFPIAERSNITRAARAKRAVLMCVLVAAVIGLASVFALEARRRSLYWYDVGADYSFDFRRGSDVQHIPVRVSADGFDFPSWEGSWDSAFLKLTIASTVLGTWAEPAVDVIHMSGSCPQYFERAAKGQRYVNLCLDSTRATPRMHVRLDGQHLDWQDQSAELLLFSTPMPDDARHLVLAPHPDDAEIAAFGTYAHRNSWIVTVTNGSYGGTAYDALVSSAGDADRLQADLRVADSLAAPVWAGLPPDRAVSLGYFTTTLARMHREPTRVVTNAATQSTDISRWRHGRVGFIQDRSSARSTWDSLVTDLELLLKELQPDVVIAPHPSLDANLDHVFTTAAFLEALERCGDPSLRLLLYTNHHVHAEYYPFGPAGAAVTLPPWFDDDLPLRAVLSHPLSRSLQQAKLFALDAMHDLRPAPQPVVGSVAGRLLGRVREAAADITRDPVRDLSYFRRAVRPNELFLTYTTEDRVALQQLVHRRGGHTSRPSRVMSGQRKP